MPHGIEMHTKPSILTVTLQAIAFYIFFFKFLAMLNQIAERDNAIYSLC